MAFAVEEDIEKRESGAEFAGAKEMGGVARPFGVGELEFGERFVEEMAAGAEGGFDFGECGAVEIVEAED